MSAPWPFRQDEWDALKAAKAQTALVDMQRKFAASQADLTQALTERDWLLAEAPDELRERYAAVPRVDSPRRATPHLDRLREDLARVRRERDGVREELARQAAECEDLRAQLGHLRSLAATAVAELRGLAAFNRADANRFRGTSSPFGFGPTRAAEAYERAAAIVELACGLLPNSDENRG